MAVSAANTAESAAYSSHPRPRGAAGVLSGRRSIIRSVPAIIPAMAAALSQVIGSPSRSQARSIVSTVELLSTGVTWLTVPSLSAWK